MDSDTQVSSPCPVVTIGGKYYALLRQFRVGALSVVWQAQVLPSLVSSPNYFNEKLDGKELLAFLRKENDLRWEPNSTLSNELVAIKVPNPEEVLNLPAEAKNLKLRDIDSRTRKIVELKADHSRDPECPCLILAWAEGVQLSSIERPLIEKDALFLAFQIVQAIESIFATAFVTLTDSIKPDSLFWSVTSANRQVTIIDLGMVGDKSQLEDETLPILGDTLYFALTKDHVGQIIKKEPVPDSLGIKRQDTKDAFAWPTISYGTRLIIKQIFDRSFLPQDRRDEVEFVNKAIANLRVKLEAQIALWDKSVSELLRQARRELRAEEAINLFDIVWALGEPQQDTDIQTYQKHWQTLVGQWLAGSPLSERVDQIKRHYSGFPEKNTQIATILLTDNTRWFHEKYPHIDLFRRALLLGENVSDVLEQDWESVREGLVLMAQGDTELEKQLFESATEKFAQAHKLLSLLFLPLKLESLLTEARFLSVRCVVEASLRQQRIPVADFPSLQKQLEEIETLFTELQNRYAGELVLQHWKTAVENLKTKLNDLAKNAKEQAEDVQTHLTNGDYENANLAIQAFAENFKHKDLECWRQAVANGKEIESSLDALQQTTNRVAHEEALTQLKKCIQSLQTGWPSNTQLVDYEKTLQTAGAHNFNGLILLNRYIEAISWLERFPNLSDKQISRVNWEQLGSQYKSILQKYESALKERENCWSQVAEARNNADYERYDQDIQAWREQTKQAILHLGEALKAEFYFLWSGESIQSIHLTQSALLNELGLHDEAAQAAKASQSIFVGILARELNSVWLSANEETRIKNFLEQSEAIPQQQINHITPLARDITRYYLRQEMEGDKVSDHLRRLGLLKLGALADAETRVRAEQEKLLELAKSTKDNELALSYTSLALVAEPGSKEARQTFEIMSERWLQDERQLLNKEIDQTRQELNKNIVTQLQRLFVEERLGNTFDVTANMLQDLERLPLEQPSRLSWLSLSQNLLLAENLLDRLSPPTLNHVRVEIPHSEASESDADVETSGKPLQDSEGGKDNVDDNTIEQTYPAPLSSHKKRLADLYEQILDVLGRKIGQLTEVALEENADLYKTLPTSLLASWEEILLHLQMKLGEKTTEPKLTADWDSLQKQIEVSKNVVSMTQLIHDVETYLNQKRWEIALERYQAFAQLFTPAHPSARLNASKEVNDANPR